MFSTALVIFREVFEIVLIVGIILAATRGLPGRGKWIGIGMLAGLGGSALVALFTESISNFAEGMGQELFNAGVLFVAALFIGWTLLWMKRHAHEMKARFSRIGEDISSGDLPFYSLSAVIALAMLREGSEIVLFTYGMLASGQSVASIASGALLGSVAGLVIGGLLYLGLISISMKHFFRITGALLMLLVAGMVSQGFGFLIAAGYFDSLAQTAWDSSWLLSEASWVGKTLNALIGYVARPAVIQIIMYAVTLVSLILLTRKTASNLRRPPAQSVAAAS